LTSLTLRRAALDALAAADDEDVVGDGKFPWSASNRMTLAEARPIGDVVFLRYLLPRRSTPRSQQRPGAPPSI